MDSVRDYDNYWLIYRLGGDLIGMCGFYDSWNGTEWFDADIVDVESYEVTETHWREAK